MWGAYSRPEQTVDSYLGTVHVHDAEQVTQWRVQGTSERYGRLDDPVRAMRRPKSWQRDKDRARRWAQTALDDPSLRLLDIQTTGLAPAWVVQIAVLDAAGQILLAEFLDPSAEITSAASALHGITAATVQGAPGFGDLLPELTGTLHGQRCVAYGMRFDFRVLAGELLRHFTAAGPAMRWMRASRWEDATLPFAVSAGLWSDRHRNYRWQLPRCSELPGAARADGTPRSLTTRPAEQTARRLPQTVVCRLIGFSHDRHGGRGTDSA